MVNMVPTREQTLLVMETMADCDIRPLSPSGSDSGRGLSSVVTPVGVVDSTVELSNTGVLVVLEGCSVLVRVGFCGGVGRNVVVLKWLRVRVERVVVVGVGSVVSFEVVISSPVESSKLPVVL